MCFTLMPASFLWGSGRQLFQILDIVLEWKGEDSRQLPKKPIMPFKKPYLFLLRSNSLKKQLLVSPAVNFHQAQTECTLRLPTDSQGIKGKKGGKIDRRMREVKEWILTNEACAALNWRNRKMSILEKIIARFRWFTLLSQLYGWFILVFFFFFFNLTWWVRAVLADGLLVVYALQAGGELQGGRLRIKIVVEWLLSNVEWCALCFSEASIAQHRDWICVCCEDWRDWPAS